MKFIPIAVKSDLNQISSDKFYLAEIEIFSNSRFGWLEIGANIAYMGVHC